MSAFPRLSAIPKLVARKPRRPVHYEVEGNVRPKSCTTMYVQPDETFKPFRFHLHGDLRDLVVASVKIGVVEQMNHPIGLVGDCEPTPISAEAFVRVPFSPVWLDLDTCDKSLTFSVELVNIGRKNAKVRLEIEGDATS